MRLNLQDYCKKYGMEHLLEQWDSEKNGEITPNLVTPASHKEVWWRCENGHEWQGRIDVRTRGGACPFCSKRVLIRGFNDLASVNPLIAAEWHPVLNGELKPSDVFNSTHRKVWWRCNKGHEWKSEIKSRAEGSDCPYCKNRAVLPGENDFATTHPDLAAQWHPTKNGTLMPDQVFGGTDKKVWWLGTCGHEWQARVSSRTTGAGCPVCAGKAVLQEFNDLRSAEPVIAAQWHPTKNQPVTPSDVTVYSNRRFWWQCEKGHEWQASVAERAFKKSNCPYCMNKKILAGFNDLATLKPELAKQWHPTLNGKLTPDMVSLGSSKKVWWKCPNDHVWQAVIYSRTSERGCGCPICAGKKVNFAWRFEEAEKIDL